MDFDHTLFSGLDRDAVWQLFEQAFTNSTRSPIWPNDLERLSSGGLREGERVSAFYRAPLTGFRAKQHYLLHDVEPGVTFSYRVGRKHPLVGGGTVELQSIATGTKIRWYGSYEVPARPDAWVAAGFVKLYFEERFFEQLDANLKAYERSS